MLRILGRAAQDTLRQAGHVSGFVWLAGVPSVALVAHYLLFGRQEMIEEVPPYVSLLAGLGVAVVGLFVVNLIAAPYRTQRERGDKAGEAIRRLEATQRTLADEVARLSGHRPELAVRVDQVGFGVTTDGRGITYIQVSIRNCGTMASVADEFEAQLRTSLGEVWKLPLYTVKDMKIPGTSLRLRHEDAIYERAISPIPPGGKVSGHLVSFTERPPTEEEAIGSTTTVSLEDVTGRHHEASFTLTEPGALKYIPGGMAITDE